jgi:hypothetical protein
MTGYCSLYSNRVTVPLHSNTLINFPVTVHMHSNR